MLEGKVILITGALGTLGRSAVSMFLQRGAVVIGNDIRPIDAVPEVGKLGEQYGKERFMFIQADVTDEEQVKGIVEAIDRRYGRLDGSYHNTYTNVWKPLLELSLSEWENNIRGSLTSTFLVCKYVVPLMIRSGGGSIVNTSSILGQLAKKGCLGYGAAKAGVNHFTRVLAMDYAEYGIRANVLVPGDFKSPEKLAQLSEASKEMIRRETMLGRSGTPEEINEVAAFLLSDASSYVTGALFTADGGYHV